MSDNTTNSTRTLHAEPDLEPPNGLSAATGAVYAKLVTLTDNEGATNVELALAAGLGRSTTGKALVTLEKNGLAIRTSGGHDGPRRTPDRWRAAPAPRTSSSDGSSTRDTTPTDSEPSTTNASESHASHTDDESAPAAATAMNSEESNSDGEASVTITSAPDAPHDASRQDSKQTDEDAENEPNAHHNGGSNDRPEPETTCKPARQESAEHPTTASVTAAIQPGGKKRLAPGALRQLVIEHLRAHPDEAFTATRISRAIEKSSGAIANALDKLVKDRIAEQVSGRPRTYRMATPHDVA